MKTNQAKTLVVSIQKCNMNHQKKPAKTLNETKTNNSK